MLVQILDGALSSSGLGGSLPIDSGLQYLANLPAAPNANPPATVMWRADRGSLDVPSAGNLRWRSIIGNKALTGAYTNPPTRTENINSKSTLTFSGVYELDNAENLLDVNRNTVFMVIKPSSSGSFLVPFGPKTEPGGSAPTDDVMAIGYTNGVLRWVTDAGNASLFIGSDDIRGAPHLVMLTMSPEHGKAIWIDGLENIRRIDLTASLTVRDVSFGNFGNDGARFLGDIRCLGIVPGQDWSDPYFQNVFDTVTEYLMLDAGLSPP